MADEDCEVSGTDACSVAVEPAAASSRVALAPSVRKSPGGKANGPDAGEDAADEGLDGTAEAELSFIFLLTELLLSGLESDNIPSSTNSLKIFLLDS